MKLRSPLIFAVLESFSESTTDRELALVLEAGWSPWRQDATVTDVRSDGPLLDVPFGNGARITWKEHTIGGALVSCASTLD